MGLTNCKPAPTPSVVGSVKHKLDDDVDLDTQACRLYRGIVGSVQHLSIDRCDVQFETNAGAKEINECFVDATETVGAIPGRNPVSKSCSHETCNWLRPT